MNTGAELSMYERVLGVIAEPLGWLLSFLYELIGTYGIAIIIFTLIVRGCLFPLYAKQIRYSAVMKNIQPKMQEIQRKYANDRETMNIKMMELYKEEKFSPMSGCLPMIIQLPIIMGLFVLLRNPIAFMDNPAMIMGVHESFLWVRDLSQPDAWILPIAAAFVTFVSYSLTGQVAAGGAGAQGAGMMKIMKYFFPIMIFLMGRAFPAGLTLYWFIGTSFMVVQTLATKKMREEAMGTAKPKKEPKKA